MATQQFTLSSLKRLDLGKIEAAFGVELERVVADMHDRPALETPRTVNIGFKFIPVSDAIEEKTGAAADLDRVKVECTVTSHVPKRITKVYEMTPKRVRGPEGKVAEQLFFNPDLPDEPEGETLLDAQEKEEDLEHDD